MAQMQLARVHGPGDVRLDWVDQPKPGPEDIVVRLQAVGICGSDLGYIKNGGMAPGVVIPGGLALGHECAGIVTEVGSAVQGIAPGLRVAVNPDDSMIGSGAPEGAMAPYVLVRGARLGSGVYALPDNLPAEEAALAEPLSVAECALNRVAVRAGERVAILGAGPIGLCAVAMAKARGAAEIVVIDPVASRLARARRLGAAVTVNPLEEDPAEALLAAHGRDDRFGRAVSGTDAFIDCAGVPAALTNALNVAKFRARCAIVALYKAPCPIDLFALMANEITITGSIALARHAEFAAALEVLARREFDVSAMISHRIDFADFFAALDVARDAQTSAKVMLTFGAAA